MMVSGVLRTYGLLHVGVVFSSCFFLCLQEQGIHIGRNAFFFSFCFGLHLLNFHQV